MSHPYPLTEAQIDFYRQNGFVKLEDVLTPGEVDELRRAVDEVLQMRFGEKVDFSSRDPAYEKIFVQKVNLWRVHDTIRRHTLDPRLADIARRLAGVERIRLWHDHLLAKMPRESKQTAWHQDFPYWPMNETGQLSCWMALDDVDEANGCMHFIPGSHLWGALDPIDLVQPQDIFALVPDKDPKDFAPVAVPLKAGSCTFHNGLTFHFAGANRTDRPRRALVTIYMPDGTTYNGKPHVVTDGLDLSAGAPLAGELFPVLSAREANLLGEG